MCIMHYYNAVFNCLGNAVADYIQKKFKSWGRLQAKFQAGWITEQQGPQFCNSRIYRNIFHTKVFLWGIKYLKEFTMLN